MKAHYETGIILERSLYRHLENESELAEMIAPLIGKTFMLLKTPKMEDVWADGTPEVYAGNPFSAEGWVGRKAGSDIRWQKNALPTFDRIITDYRNTNQLPAHFDGVEIITPSTAITNEDVAAQRKRWAR